MKLPVDSAALNVVAVMGLVLCSCNPTNTTEKVSFDIQEINDDGLMGPPDGLVSVDYMFRIPDKTRCIKEVKSHDSTILVLRADKGLFACNPGLCGLQR